MLWTNIYPIFRARSNLFQNPQHARKVEKKISESVLTCCRAVSRPSWTFRWRPCRWRRRWSFGRFGLGQWIAWLFIYVCAFIKWRKREEEQGIILYPRRVTSNSFFHLACLLDLLDARKRKKKNQKKKLWLCFVAKTKNWRERWKTRRRRRRTRWTRVGGGGNHRPRIQRHHHLHHLLLLLINNNVNIFKVVALRPFRPCHSAASRLA